MNYRKMLGLLAVAAAALMALAGSVSAATLTSPKGTVYTGTITAATEESLTWHGPFTDISCGEAHIEGSVEQHGVGVTAKGKITTFSFGKCNFAITIEALGTLEVHPVTTTAENKVVACTSGECTGTVTLSGQKMVMHTSVGTCGFATSNTDIGLLTPTNDTGKTATLDIGAHGTGIIPRTEGSFLCGSSAQWTGSYSVTTPDSLYIDA